jgi:hypothetical protein
MASDFFTFGREFPTGPKAPTLSTVQFSWMMTNKKTVIFQRQRSLSKMVPVFKFGFLVQKGHFGVGTIFSLQYIMQ